MDFETIDRGLGASQESVTADQLLAMSCRAFGSSTKVLSAVELGGGLYNNTYLVDLGEHRPVILRVAPEPGKQWRIERELMRNEYASLPFFASISSMMPTVLFADWTHEIVGRDYMWQTVIDGVPAHEGLNAYPRPQRTTLFQQVGTLAKTIHDTCGNRFGRVAGPHYDTWSEAVLHSFVDAIADLEAAGIEAGDVRNVLAIAADHKSVLDEIKEPRLLHGDLWVPNLMLKPGAEEPTIIGVLDHDRSSWGDPMADWVVFVAQRRPGTERDGFWQTYGTLSSSTNALWRRLIYRASHLSAIRLELIRLGRRDELRKNYDEMSDVLGLLE